MRGIKTVLGAAAGLAMLGMTAPTAQADGHERQIAQDAYTLAHGGRLYDKWFSELRMNTPTDTHSAWPSTNERTGDQTWRCKSCHGWDYMGAEGAYSSGSYLTGIPGIRGMAGADPAAIVAILTDETHGFGDHMRGPSLEALALFVSQGQIDMDQYINRETRAALGNVEHGAAIYGSVCLGCHGAEGKLPADMPALGGLANENPWEILHKIMYGQPKENMPAVHTLGVDLATDLLTYLQTLPE